MLWWRAPDSPLSPFKTLNTLWGHVLSRLGYCDWRHKKIKTAKSVQKTHLVFASILNIVGYGWVRISSVSSPSPCVRPSSTPSPLCSPHWTGCELDCMFTGTEHTRISKESAWCYKFQSVFQTVKVSLPANMEQCLHSCCILFPYVAVWLIECLLVCTEIILRWALIRSDTCFQDLAMLQREANTFSHLPLSCLLWTLLFEPHWESIRAPSRL